MPGTKIIDNFSGVLTRDNIGDMNSGLAKYNTTFGNDPFSNIGNLTWLQQPIALNPINGGSVITDLIVTAKPRLENGITYVYAIGHTGRFYKIQVNDPATQNPNLDNAVLITTLTINSPTFKYGSSIQFYGLTQKIFIGHDLGVTKINFDGSGETFVGILGSYTANVPRPSVNFLGKLEFGNGNNLVEIDSTETVTSYAKLSPTFPVGTFVRDIDVSPDGIYLEMIVSELNSPDLTSTVQDTTSLSSTDSFKFLWNGTDIGYTSYQSFSGYSITSNQTFGPYSYVMGYDLGGAAIYSGGSNGEGQKIVTLPTLVSPNFEALFSTGNLLGIASPEYDFTTQNLAGSILFYGQYDEETPKGLFRFLKQPAGFINGNDVDIIQMPVCLIVSNLFYGSSSAGYDSNRVGVSKVYFSTLETSLSPTDTSYGFYTFNLVPDGSATPIAGVYETQNETSFKLFHSIVSKKFKITQVRIYAEPIPNITSFIVDLIGGDGNPIAGTTNIFNIGGGGSNYPANVDMVQYNPQMAPVYSVGIRITNNGSETNFTIIKIELDYVEGGVK